MNKSILIAEDDPKNQMLFNDLLEVSGYRTFVAGNGAECIDLAKEKKPDLILMDIQMPVMNGYEAVRILKSDPVTRSIPVIALTAYAMKGDDKKAISHGYDGYISKPIDIKGFIQKVNDYV